MLKNLAKKQYAGKNILKFRTLGWWKALRNPTESVGIRVQRLLRLHHHKIQRRKNKKAENHKGGYWKGNRETCHWSSGLMVPFGEILQNGEILRLFQKIQKNLYSNKYRSWKTDCKLFYLIVVQIPKR